MDRKNTNQTGWPVTKAMAAAEEAEANAAAEQAAANGVAVYPPANHTSHQTQVPGRLPSMTMLRYPPGLAPVVPLSSVPPGLVALPADYNPFRPINTMGPPFLPPGNNYGQNIAGRPRGLSQPTSHPTSFQRHHGNNSNLYTVREAPASGYSDTYSVQEQAPVANSTPSGSGSEMDYGTDPLANPYLTPSPGRRGHDHINNVLNMIDNARLTPSPQDQPVPWREQTRIINPNTQAAPAQHFVPMRTVQEKLAQQRATGHRIPGANGMFPPSPEPEPEPSNLRKRMCKANGFSVNYKGDISNAANRSANIPDHLNCSLWIVGLYAGMTVSRLLHGVTLVGPTGKIFATVISDAQPDKGHNGAAAKIVFFDRVGAERLKAAIEAQRLDNILGRRVRVSFNRIRSAPQVHSNLSRVLFIWGPRELVNHLRLHALFKDKVEYQTEAVVIHEDNADGAVIEWRFGSYRNQASAVNNYLSVEHNTTLRWMYADDPCATGKSYPGGVDVTRDITN
ncbi:hypothetical protein F5X68DRAFT_70313 [Plectosphaerella plurivora]|uniref:RRM domain-containing protein n=1 Tax=Plectosphaerella plurivora TaxID=936078 RepID=A0A9P8VEK1_9PEZI|nr:hypothetical protein F5X68DRAFT_70313 [Plectosphaerella plurivora]